MNEEIYQAAFLYCTDREKLQLSPDSRIHLMYLNESFLNATTRPDVSERIAIKMLGFNPKTEKHGLDGLPSTQRPNQYAECKVITTTTERTNKIKRDCGRVTINDPSTNIISKYDNASTLFVFPLYIDGYLISIFSVDWLVIKPVYLHKLEKQDNHNKTKQDGKSALRSFSLTSTDWMSSAEIEFIYPSQTIAKQLLDKVSIPPDYKKRIYNHYEQLPNSAR